MNSGTEILRILKDQNIKVIININDYSMCNNAEPKDSIYGREDTWIGDVFNIIKRDMKRSSKQLLAGEKKYITFSDDSDDTIKYACMFPKTSINLKEKFDEYVSDKGCMFYTMPKDFFRSLLRRKRSIMGI